jgi:hypothetical protein
MIRQRQRYRQRLRHTYGRQSINRALSLVNIVSANNASSRKSPHLIG